MDCGGKNGYIKFDQIAGDALLPTVINKDQIIKMVLK